MAFTTPTTASGQVLTSSIWNASVRDNLEYLYDYGPGRSRAELTHNTTQSIANATPAAVTFNTESVDAFGLHAAGNPTRITIPSGFDGWWAVAGLVSFASNATGIRNLAIIANTGAYAANTSTPAISGLDHALSVSGLIRLVAGNYLELFVYQSSGGALNLQSGPIFRAAWIAEAG